MSHLIHLKKAMETRNKPIQTQRQETRIIDGKYIGVTVTIPELRETAALANQLKCHKVR